MAEAERILRAKWPSAILMEAQGTPTKGFAESAGDIDQWLFVAHVGQPMVMTAMLPWRDSAFGSPKVLAQPWLGNVISPIASEMSLEAAITLLRKADLGKPFTSVTLREPLTHPPQIEASYLFSFPGGWYGAVGVLTGKVAARVPTLTEF